MVYYCTYCSKSKVISKELTPAYLLYQSKRIKDLHINAQKKGVQLLILSGKHGLIPAEKPIRYYDKLLLQKEIKNHAKLINSQLLKISISKIFFFHKSVNLDPKLSNYLKCISIACKSSKIELIFKEIE